MKKLLFLLPLLGLLLLGGCASGPSYSVAKDMIPPLAPGQARLVFYRTSVLGAAVQPPVRVNGEKVGTATAQGFFVKDLPPGNYEISTATEVKRTLSVALEAGQTRYVRLEISMGFFAGHVSPVLVEPAVGEIDVQKCKYTGGGK
jgi:hypothetical protein